VVVIAGEPLAQPGLTSKNPPESIVESGINIVMSIIQRWEIQGIKYNYLSQGAALVKSVNCSVILPLSSS
jgi:hypothetical protein